jgi:hypothetical protein
MDIKTFYCTGNLNKGGEITTALSPNLQLSIGTWQLSLKEVLLDASNVPTVKYVGIAVNLVTGYKWNDDYKKFVSECSPLNIILFEKVKKRILFDCTWSLIDNVAEKLVISFEDLETKKPLKVNSDVYITILFQRIK